MEDQEDLAIAKTQAVQAQRELDAVEALAKEKRQKLREALALVAAREPVALVGVPEPSVALEAAIQAAGAYYITRHKDAEPDSDG